MKSTTSFTLLMMMFVLHAFTQPLLIWENRFDYNEGYESPQIMKIGANNDIYITGISNVDTFDNDILTFKINSDGTTAWYHIIRNDYDDGADGLVVDNEGNCYLAGGLGDIYLDSSRFLLRYNDDGSLQWIDMLAFGIQGLSIDKNENIHTVSSYQNILLTKYNLSGDILLEFSNDTSYSGHNYNADLFEVDSSLNLYVSGTYTVTDFNSTKAFLKKFSPEGDILMDIKYDPTTKNETPILMQVNNLGNTYLAGTIGLPYWGIFLAKFNPSGTLLWDQVIEHDTIHIYDLILDAEQNPVICGKEYDVNSEAVYFIKKYDQQGNEIWMDYPGWGGPYSKKVAYLLTDAQSNIYFAGSTFPDDADPYFMMSKYDKYGNKLWEYETDSILHELNDYIKAMSFDIENNIVMSLQSKGDILTLKFADLTGIEILNVSNPTLNISPNPFHSTANVSYSNHVSQNPEVTISLFDVYGRELKAGTFEKNYQLDRTGIPNGIYLLQVASPGNFISSAKVIIY